MTGRDRYRSFAELSRSEHEGQDYRRWVARTDSPIVVIAPHGGGIEPGTSEIATAVAADEFSCYVFGGIKRSGNELLHITSTAFDDPICLELLRSSQVVVAFHGCQGREALVHMGGTHAGLKVKLVRALRKAGFEVREAGGDYSGDHPRNLCNRARSGLGVQLELSEALRQAMFKDVDHHGRLLKTERFDRFVLAVQATLRASSPEMGGN
jgi:phage replication-related protein YjqB (UPF0714/DUF867 family)